MRVMRSPIALGTLGCAIAISLSMAVSAQQLSGIDAVLRPLVDSEQLAGVVALALQNGRTVHASALGKRDLENGAPMQMDTIFRAYSMTKPVTAVAMMTLWDQGKWKPEDPVSKFVPELKNLKVFTGLDAAGQPILVSPEHEPTLNELMTHTAGFGYGVGQGWVEDQFRAASPLAATSSDEFVRRLAALPLRYQPGTQWQYSIGADIEGLIVERLSGLPLAEFMAKGIFERLGMIDSGFFLPPDKRARLASVYTWANGKLRPQASPVAGEAPRFASGGGGLVTLGGGLLTTAPDYARLGQMLLNGGVLDGRRILSEKAAQMMMTDHLPNALVPIGFGVGFQKLRPGYQFGFNGVVVTDPAAAGVALGRGSYLWDGAAGTWFWVDPENRIVFVGMVQRIMSAGGFPPVQDLTQRAMKSSLR